jgi:hypothetical protein
MSLLALETTPVRCLPAKEMGPMSLLALETTPVRCLPANETGPMR